MSVDLPLIRLPLWCPASHSGNGQYQGQCTFTPNFLLDPFLIFIVTFSGFIPFLPLPLSRSQLCNAEPRIFSFADRTSIVMKAVMTTREAGLLFGKGGKTNGKNRVA